MNDGKYNFYKLPSFVIDPAEQYNNITFKAKKLYLFMYNKDINPFTKKETDENGNLCFKLTIKEIQELLDVTENTARKYKNELVDKKLILEVPKRGQKAARYTINKNLDLNNKASIYKDAHGNKCFSFIEVPEFLFNSYFNNLETEDLFIYSFIRNVMNYSLKVASEGKRTFVTRGGRVFCLLSNEDIKSSLNLNNKKLQASKKRLCAAKLLRIEESSNDKRDQLRYIISEPISLPKVKTTPRKVLIYRNHTYAKRLLLYYGHYF